MTGFLLLCSLCITFLILLVAESIIYNRRISRIPIRISVSGTRGKTSVVRTLASICRSHGMRVLAKTTGSEAIFILPNGTSEKISRKGLTTILEQKRLISKALKLDVQCIITEIMSIHPDNHKTETQKLIKPGITLLTNFRADHTDVVGSSAEEISRLFIHDIYPGSTVILPETEVNKFIIKGIGEKKAKLITAPMGTCQELDLPVSVFQEHIPANLDLVMAAAQYLGIPKETIRTGILNTQLDIGQLEIFRLHENNRKIWFINAFAANDPVSTSQIISKTGEILAAEMTGTTKLAGILSLRSDRGERSRQWLDYLRSDGNDLFTRIYVSGTHSPIFARKLNNVEQLRTHDPKKITRQIIESTQGDILVFGIANIHGLGKQLIGHWKLTNNRQHVGGQNPPKNIRRSVIPAKAGTSSR
ncbi:MAG: poly-gamma-glutamate synthase PgsB [Bacteroidales bacterium]|jgi:poly-gamma-glutamate synthase PgsB/CapB